MTAAISEQFSLPADLRAWQRHALTTYLAQSPRDFSAVATPGAGKTRFALVLAAHLMRTHEVQRLTIVTPTEHLKTQWADAAAARGHRISTRRSATPTGTRPRLPRRRRDLRAGGDGAAVAPRAAPRPGARLVVLDEIHHAGDALSWGDAVREAFEPAVRRLDAHRHAVPLRRQPDPVRDATSADGDGCMRSRRTPPTATATRCATASSGR